WFGQELGATIGLPRVIDVAAALIALEPKMAQIVRGHPHGTRWVPDCTDASRVQNQQLPEKRPRFAALAVLYGWVLAGNEQFIYHTTTPQLVVSVDHGHFFPNGPDWSIPSIGGAPPPQLNPLIAGACHFTEAERAHLVAR